MANSFTQLYIQLVFALDINSILPNKATRERLEKYICGTVSRLQSKVYAIYCNPDHIHILISIHPQVSISKLVNKIKSNSSKWINEEGMANSKFNWQIGYGAFSYSNANLPKVIRYIENQPIHHQTMSFQSEYEALLQEHEIRYSKTYLFEFLSDS